MTTAKSGLPCCGEVETDPVVLVVEDDELVRTAIDGLLRSAGYRVVTYASALLSRSQDSRRGVLPR